MVTLAANNMTIEDAVRSTDSKGNMLPTGEILNQRNGIVPDLRWREGNLVAGHAYTQRTSLPAIFTVVVGQGTPETASSKAQIIESPEILGGWQVMDENVANYGADPAAKRASEDVAFIESFDETVAKRVFYGNGASAPGQMNGLSVRYGTIAANTGGTKQMIVDGGGTGSINMSCWLVGHSPNAFYAWYPMGTPGGLYRKDWGPEPRTNADGTTQVVYRTQYQWSIGIALQDPRYVSRLCNVDRATLTAGTSPDLFTKMIQQINLIFDINACAPTYYCNRTYRMMLEVQARNDVLAGGQLKYDVVDGKRIEFFQNIPVTYVDQLTLTEGRVV